MAKNGPAERQNLACEVKIHLVFSISMFFGPFWNHFGVQDGVSNKGWFLIDFWPLGEAFRGSLEAQVGLLNFLKILGSL